MRLFISREALKSSPAIKTASQEELRTLLALVAREGSELSAESVAEETGILKSRVAAAIALFTEEGVLTSSKEPTITEEFEERLRRGEVAEVTSLDTARTIRDENLASLIDEIARLMKKDSLSTSEIKIITSLASQYSLSPEFLLLLAAHLADTNHRLTATLLRDKALQLFEAEITTVEELERYIESRAAESDVHREFRSVMGLYGGALSETQRKYFNRWGIEFGFGSAIVAEAYDRAALYANRSMKYMDKILTSWHEAGCKTVAECIAHSESTKSEQSAVEKKPARQKKPEPVRYGDFDINDAFEKALLRSYGKDNRKNGKDES